MWAYYVESSHTYAISSVIASSIKERITLRPFHRCTDNCISFGAPVTELKKQGNEGSNSAITSF